MCRPQSGLKVWMLLISCTSFKYSPECRWYKQTHNGKFSKKASKYNQQNQRWEISTYLCWNSHSSSSSNSFLLNLFSSQTDTYHCFVLCPSRLKRDAQGSEYQSIIFFFSCQKPTMKKEKRVSGRSLCLLAILFSDMGIQKRKWQLDFSLKE